MTRFLHHRSLAFRLAVLVGVAAGAAIGALIAFSFFSSTSPAQANTASAGTIGTGHQPTFVVSGRDVTVSWAAATNATSYTVAAS